MVLDEPQKDDETYTVEGLTWLVSPRDRGVVLDGGGVRVDHVRTWYGEAFSVLPRRYGLSRSCC